MTGLIGSGLNLRTVYVSKTGEKRLIVSVTNSVVIWKTANPDLAVNAKSQGSATLESFKRWIASEHPASESEKEAFNKITRWRKYDLQTAKKVRAIKKRLRGGI